MLILHPTSTCDVCLERYAWDATSAESKPHVISCGHVFCHQCLQNLVARTCPLCRKPFHLSRAVRVHIDLTTEDMSYVMSVDELEARQYEGRILRAAGDDVMDENSQTTIEEAVEWLRERPLNSHPNLRSAVSLLRRYKAIQQEVHGAREEVRAARNDRDAYKRALKQKMREWESDKVLHRGVNENWSTRVTELTADYERKLIDAETRRLSVEDEFKRFRSVMSAQLHSHAEAYASSQAQLQAQIQQTQTRTRTESQSQDAASSSIAFPTVPSQPDSSYETSYHPQNNPLPRPPEPIPLAMLPDFARPASRSFREGERRERRKEKERHREKDVDRDRDREKRRRHKERGAATDRETSAAEVQERRPRKARQSFTEGAPPSEIPRDVVGGWGLERTWRASLNGSNTDLSLPAGTSRRREKGKTRERERERDRGEYTNLESASEQEGEYVFVELSAQEERKERERERRHREKERRNLGVGHASSSRLRGKEERDRERGAESGRETRERKRDAKERESRRASMIQDSVMQPQVVPVPVPVPISISSSYLQNASNTSNQSALGLILVPSPDGKGYEYRYAPIQGSTDSGRTVILAQNHVEGHGQPIAVAPSFATSTYSNNYSNSSSDAVLRAPTATAYHSYAPTQTSTAGPRSPHPVRRATDPVIPGQGYDSSLHVPQPRRISTHIPEVDPSPEPSSGNTSGASTVVPTSQPNLGLDAAIAQMHLSQPPPRPRSRSSPMLQQVAGSSAAQMELTPSQQQELKHKTSTTSTTSNTSTSISLTGSTSGERRKQLLDALFPSTGTTPGATAAGSQAAAAASARGLPSVDGRPSRGLSTRPQSAMPPQSTQTNAHARQATYPPVTFSNAYSSYYQQPHAASSTSLTSTFVDTREPTYPGGYATVEAAQAWSTSGAGEARQRTKTDISQ